MVASVWRLASSTVWTSDRLSRSDEGKAVGFEWVIITLEDVSTLF
jgi:hypothetical protein